MRASSLVPAAILAAATLCAASGARADLTVSTAATRSVTCSGGVCTTTAASANLSILDLKTMLASGSVQLKPGSLSQNIVIAASVFWSNGSTLTLDAYKSIAIDMPIQVAGPGSLTMTTNDGGTGGLLTYDPKANITFLSLSSRLVIDGASFKLVNSIQALAQALAFNSVVNYALANSYDAKADGIYTAPPLNEADGIVDGLNNTISNLTVAVPSPGKLAGFLKELGTYATMRNFILTNAQVRADTGTGVRVGALIAQADSESIVDNVGVDGTVSGPGDTGGVIGQSGAYVDRCRSSANVTGGDAGGLIGFNFSGSVTNSTSSGQVKQKGSDRTAGGLVGTNFAEGIVSLSSSSATVKGAKGAIVGGLVGSNDGPIDHSFATGNVTSKGDESSAGGLIGETSSSAVSTSYATGAVTGSGKEGWVGGLVGNNGNVLLQTYSTGRVTAKKGTEGGGLIGVDGQEAKLSYNYWDTTTSGITDPGQGAADPKNDKGITGLSDSALKGALPSGFDITTWARDPKINGGLPYLIANPPAK